MKNKKKISIEDFIKSNSHELENIEVKNCYFANLSASLIIRGVDPAIIFGGLLGFETYEMKDSKSFLGNYIDYYFERTWNIDTDDGFFVSDEVGSFENIQMFKKKLTEKLKYNDPNRLIGLIMDAKNVFYRNDIDLEFWGEDFISHFCVISSFDFENDTLTLLDVTPGKDTEKGFPIVKTLNISTLLVYLRKNKDFVSLVDIDSFIERIIEENKGYKGAIEKVVQSLCSQANEHINKSDLRIISPVEWITNEWKHFSDKDSDIWNKWLEPRLNIFNTLVGHRYYVSIFVEKYLQQYFKIPVTGLLKFLEEEEKAMNNLKYLCYKFSVSTKEKSLKTIKKEIQELLNKINTIEMQISEILLNNIKIVDSI